MASDEYVSPVQRAAVVLGLSRIQEPLYAGRVLLTVARRLDLDAVGLGVLLTGRDGRPVGVWVVSTAPLPGTIPIEPDEAGRQADTWMALRQLDEVACSPLLCRSLPREIKAARYTRDRRNGVVGGRFCG